MLIPVFEECSQEGVRYNFRTRTKDGLNDHRCYAVPLPLHELGQLHASVVEPDMPDVPPVHPIYGLAEVVAAECLAGVGEPVVAAA
ncbi:hypothetical protein StoSoilB13_23230 [Arthrobacter sp. StoSoilB13]|nr:hypothetical protein StoSoilB13_23230 [Arthrobacter sp. StoSoilB13]